MNLVLDKFRVYDIHLFRQIIMIYSTIIKNISNIKNDILLGTSIQLLPKRLNTFYNKKSIKLLRFIGGVCVLYCLLDNYFLWEVSDFFFFNVLIRLISIIQIWQVIIISIINIIYTAIYMYNMKIIYNYSKIIVYLTISIRVIFIVIGELIGLTENIFIQVITDLKEISKTLIRGTTSSHKK